MSFLSSPFDAFRRYEIEHGLPTDFVRSVNAADPHANAWARSVSPERRFLHRQLTLPGTLVAVALAGCGTSSEITTASVGGSTSPPHVEGTPALIVMPTDLELGEDPRDPDGTSRSIAGHLRIEAGCVVLDGTAVRVPVWPAGTTWDGAAGAVALPDGAELPLDAWAEADARVSGAMSADPAAGGYGSAYAPQGHADFLIDRVAGLGDCLSEAGTMAVAYELAGVTTGSPPLGVDDVTVSDDVVRVATEVIDPSDNGATLCRGISNRMYPPSCGGPRITNWEWDGLAYETDTTSGRERRWGSYVVVGTYSPDGGEFTLVEPAHPAGPADHTGRAGPDWSTPCPEPAGGWHPEPEPEPTAPTSLPPDPPQIDGLTEIPGFGGAWWDRDLDVENVRIVGDAAARADAQAMVEALYDGPVCIVESAYTEAELRAVQDAVNERYLGGSSMFVTSTGVRSDASAAAVVIGLAAPVPALEAALADEFGAAVVLERDFDVVGS